MDTHAFHFRDAWVWLLRPTQYPISSLLEEWRGRALQVLVFPGGVGAGNERRDGPSLAIYAGGKMSAYRVELVSAQAQPWRR